MRCQGRKVLFCLPFCKRTRIERPGTPTMRRSMNGAGKRKKDGPEHRQLPQASHRAARGEVPRKDSMRTAWMLGGKVARAAAYRPNNKQHWIGLGVAVRQRRAAPMLRLQVLMVIRVTW